MTIINTEVFGSEFKIPQIIAEDIIEIQPMDVPFSKDYLALQAYLEHEMRRTFGYNENTFPEFFTEEEFNL